MSVVVVHLRWDDVAADQYEELCRALPDGDRLPADCLSRDLRLQGRVVRGTEVWAGSAAAERALLDLPGTVSAARLGAPVVAAFALPDAYAAPYRRARTRPSTTVVTAPGAGRPGPVPGPRTAEDDVLTGTGVGSPSAGA
jgi:hypothetical protein